MSKVNIEVEGFGTMVAELYPDIAPKTVENFLSLVDKNYYDGLTFHRIIPKFMIQGGCPDGDGTGGPGYTIVGEFDKNGHPNPLKHTRGVLSMARTAEPNTAGSQFFIVHHDSDHLDGQYAAFGKLIEGDDVLEKIATTMVNYLDQPISPVVISSITRA